MTDNLLPQPLSYEALCKIAWDLGIQHLKESGFEFRQSRQVFFALATACLHDRLTIMFQEVRDMRNLAAIPASYASLTATGELRNEIRNVSMMAMLGKSDSTRSFSGILEVLVFALEHTTSPSLPGHDKSVLLALSRKVRHLVTAEIIPLTSHPAFANQQRA